MCFTWKMLRPNRFSVQHHGTSVSVVRTKPFYTLIMALKVMLFFIPYLHHQSSGENNVQIQSSAGRGLEPIPADIRKKQAQVTCWLHTFLAMGNLKSPGNTLNLTHSHRKARAGNEPKTLLL